MIARLLCCPTLSEAKPDWKRHGGVTGRCTTCGRTIVLSVVSQRLAGEGWIPSCMECTKQKAATRDLTVAFGLNVDQSRALAADVEREATARSN
jgi:hypothetical protein